MIWCLEEQGVGGLLNRQNLLNVIKFTCQWPLKGYFGQWIDTHWICWSRMIPNQENLPLTPRIYTINKWIQKSMSSTPCDSPLLNSLTFNKLMTSQGNLKIRQYCLFWQIIKIRWIKMPNYEKKNTLSKTAAPDIQHPHSLLRLFYQIKMKGV